MSPPTKMIIPPLFLYKMYEQTFIDNTTRSKKTAKTLYNTQSWIQFLKLNLCWQFFPIIFFFKSFLTHQTMYKLSPAHKKVFSSITVKYRDDQLSKPNLQN